MSCNRCAATAEAVAPSAGAGSIEANWAGHRAHPQQCDRCGGFLRADGGCTQCDHSTTVTSDGDSAALAMAKPAGTANAAVPMRLSCGHTAETTVPAGGEEWCTRCDDFANVESSTADDTTADAVGTDSDGPALPSTEYGRAAFNAQHNRRKNPTAQAKVKDIGYSRVSAALRKAGVPRTPPTDHIRNMVWQYLDRCTCGAWVSPRSPVCNNPRCGQKGKTMGVTRPWPPGDVVWVFRKQDVGYEVGTSVPISPASKRKAPPTSASAVSKPAAPAPSISVDSYKARVDELATGYGLDADEFLPDDDWQGQIESGETPEELVARVADKHDLTPLSVTSDSAADEEAFHIALSTPDVKDVEEAWDKLNEQYIDAYDRRPVKARLTFKEPVQVRMNNRRVLTTDNITVSLFRSQQSNFCYTYYSSTGYPLDSIRDSAGNPAVDQITGIEAITPEKTLLENSVKVQKLGQSIHPNAWPNARQQMQDKPESYTLYGLNRVSMRSVFGDRVVRQLEEAFEQGKDFSYTLPGEKRTRSLEVRRQPDGTVKAWYNSEYAGYGNGDYYLLLNPYTASFKESD